MLQNCGKSEAQRRVAVEMLLGIYLHFCDHQFFCFQLDFATCKNEAFHGGAFCLGALRLERNNDEFSK